MMDESSRPGSASDDDQRRILELQLIKIRNEASAARLEARAAEIELMIRQLADHGSSSARVDPASVPQRASVGHEASVSHEAQIAGDGGLIARDGGQPNQATHRFASWNDVRSAQQAAVQTDSDVQTGSDADSDPNPGSVVGNPAVAAVPDSVQRVDSPDDSIPRPHFLAPIDGELEEPQTLDESSFTTVVSPHNDSGAEPVINFSGDADTKTRETLGDMAIEDDDEEEQPTRARPAAWLVSAITHAVVLVLLFLVTLQVPRPKDQVALSASASESNEMAMETFTIESSEPETDPTEPTASETEYELSPVGEIAASDFAPDAPPAPPAAASMATSSQMSAAAMSLSSDSDTKIQFCGVEGGGNHFVYLVDSSGSMGDAFNSAREELLRSIEVLKPDQRFYVVFFDAESDYMRLTSANEDEPRSVQATPQNIAALRRWAMRISMDRGRAPYDPLKFALKLRPDVIFLLSDGEFPQGIEDLLREENKVENLFGDSGPISIVHTIGYHSREGESRMKRIAKQNQGQYRHVAKPGT